MSGPLHISGLTVSGFRGVERSLPLDFGRRLTMLFGGNAAGKTSVVQALEFALSGQVLGPDDTALPARYLQNMQRSGPGSVSVRFFETPDTLTASTLEAKNIVARRCRDFAVVDWPERQELPFGLTHITSQGLLASVLTNKRISGHDLTGLCAGPSLRMLVGRAERVANHFRQAATGRNIMTELERSRERYEAAKAKRDAISAATPTLTIDAESLRQQCSRLAARLDAPSSAAETDTLTRWVMNQRDRSVELHGLISALMSRVGEIGRQESEANEAENVIRSLESAIAESQRRCDDLRGQLEILAVGAEEQRQARRRLADTLEAAARQEEWVQTLERARLTLADVRAQATAADLASKAATARLEAVTACGVRLQASLLQAQLRREQAAARLSALHRLAALDTVIAESSVERLRSTVSSLSQELCSLEEQRQLAYAAVSDARATEQAAEELVARVSATAARLAASVDELRLHALDGRCPLCGHQHASQAALMAAIEAIAVSNFGGPHTAQKEFTDAAARRRESVHAEAALAQAVADRRTMLDAAERDLDIAERSLSAAIAERATISARMNVAPETSVGETPTMIEEADTDAKKIAQEVAKLAEEVAGVDEERRAALQTAIFEEQRLASAQSRVTEAAAVAQELEARPVKPISVAERTSAADGVERLDRQIANGQFAADKLRGEVASIEADVVRLKGELQSPKRRSEVAAAWLAQVDADLNRVGLARSDLGHLAVLDQATSTRLNELEAAAHELETIAKGFGALSEHRLLVEAEDDLCKAEADLRERVERHGRLQRIHRRCAKLEEDLLSQQSAIAGKVLEATRTSNELLFWAMSGGAPWTLGFALEEQRVVATLLQGASRHPALNVLNAAYLNVAAVALRLALAAQQRWCRLRTAILDDPILELDPLTQAGFLDGLESLLTSRTEPWSDMQFVVTSWNEDLATLAAHRLAHLNPVGRDDFVIYRLGTNQGGDVTAERFVPRWREKSAAA